jgi:hypothetical protein
VSRDSTAFEVFRLVTDLVTVDGNKEARETGPQEISKASIQPGASLEKFRLGSWRTIEVIKASNLLE